MFSILLSSLFGIAPKSKTKRSSAWKTIDPLYFYTLKLKKLIPSSLRQFGLQTPFNFYGCFKSRVPDPVFRSASSLRTTFYLKWLKLTSQKRYFGVLEKRKKYKWILWFIFFFFPSTTNTPCHPDGVPRTRGDEGSSASAPFILILFLTLSSFLQT